MQDFIGSVRRSLVFKSSAGDDGIGGFVGKIESSIRKSRIGLFSKPPLPALPPTRMDKDDARQIRWRKGELIGCGAFGRVYMGMDLDSGELIAVKQVSIAGNFASKEKTQAHIWELEEEVKLLKNLSHPNIVRYLGTAREEECLNIMLEFVPGGSISSLLGKFGSFPESVIRMYTKQLLLGLEYLHKNGIMHRDIKGANILVDNKGCIKLADFGASKKVVELATMTGAKSMKGTPYWMAPEVIVQTGHSLFHGISPQNQLAMSSADIWSVGCTVIEMATGKPPWSQQYQEVAALFHIGTTKSHPPIPEYLSPEAKDFLLKCLQKEPSSRATASDLLQHLFVTGDYREACHVRSSVMVSSGSQPVTPGVGDDNLTSKRLKDVHNSVRCSTIYPEKFADPIWRSSNPDDDMCQLDDIDDLLVGASTKFKSTILSADIGKSFNPMSEPNDDWPCKFDESPEFPREIIDKATQSPGASCIGYGEFTFPAGPSAADDDEVTETKIRAFLDEKALDLKKLQTPLYEEFKNSNSLNANTSPVALGTENKENVSTNSCLPPKSKSPKRMPSRRLSAADVFASYKRISNVGTEQAPPDVQPPRASEQREQLLDPLPEQSISSETFSERQRLWEEELYQEIERTREIRRQKGEVKTPSPIRFLSRQKDRSRLGFTGI